MCRNVQLDMELDMKVDKQPGRHFKKDTNILIDLFEHVST